MPVLPRALEIQGEITTIRRDIHAHPELAFEENRTSDIVAAKLQEWGFEVTRGLGKTGVVGTLRRGNSVKSIGLRADMDCLPMNETNDFEHRSQNAGRMHACGHDGHTVMLLGAARELARRKNFSGTVHFIFQPAEEGRGGAKAMIEDGFFSQFPVDAVYGLHNMPGIAADSMAVVAGPQLASSDRWTVTFKGIGTHGAKPHLGRDAMTSAGQFLTALHTIVARRVDPLQPAVVSACAMEAGSFEALNVIPDLVKIGGTSRAYSAAVRDQLEEEIGALAEGSAKLYGIEAEYRYFRQMPPVVNDKDATRRALAAAQAALGIDKVMTEFPPSTAGDDFAMFSQEVPGAYVWLGNGPAVDGALHHNSRYDFNDDALASGVRFWTTLVEQELAA